MERALDLEDLAPLRFNRWDPATPNHEKAVPRLRVVNLQVLAALGLIVVGAFFFVGSVEHLATTIGIDPVILALVIAPIATELPEKFNSVIWVRQGKDTLAMGNITGAMVFQSTIPTVVALLFAADAWHFSADSRVAFGSAAIAFIASAVIFIPMVRSGRLRGQVIALGVQTSLGRPFDAAVIELFGDAPMAGHGTRLDGVMVVDRKSGVLLRLELHSGNPEFALRRTLTRIEPAPPLVRARSTPAPPVRPVARNGCSKVRASPASPRPFVLHLRGRPAPAPA